MAELQLHSLATRGEKGGHDNPAFFTDGTQSTVVGSAPPTYVNVSAVDANARQRIPINGPAPETLSDVTNGGNSYVINSPHGDDDDHDDHKDLNPCARGVDTVQKAVLSFFARYSQWILRLILVILFLAYMAYFVYALTWEFGDEGSIRLLVGTVIGVALLVLYLSWDHLSKSLSSIKPDPSRPAAQNFRKVMPCVA